MATDPSIYKAIPRSTTDPIEALGYDLIQRARVTVDPAAAPGRSTLTEYAITHCGHLHSQWMTRTELDAFASGVTHALFALHLTLTDGTIIDLDDGELVDLAEPIYGSDISRHAAHWGAVYVKVE